MPENRYSMSFTSGALLYRESILFAGLYDENSGWEQVRHRVIADNLLQVRTPNASKRLSREIISRLKLLTPDQLHLLVQGTRREQQHLLWLAVCKRYRFIYDFAVDVIHEKYLRGDLLLTYDEYEHFFGRKAEWHPEVERVAASTRAKQRQVVFKMLREADLLTDEKQILAVLLSDDVIRAIGRDDPAHFAIYPVAPSIVQEWTA